MRRDSSDQSLLGLRRSVLLSLTLGLTLGPIAALLNQVLMYSVNMWACGHRAPVAVHVVPLLCLIVAAGAGVIAWRDWRAVGGGIEDEDATIDTRTRFVALMGMALSTFSAMVIVAMWAAAFVFDPCMRA